MLLNYYESLIELYIYIVFFVNISRNFRNILIHFIIFYNKNNIFLKFINIFEYYLHELLFRSKKYIIQVIKK